MAYTDVPALAKVNNYAVFVALILRSCPTSPANTLCHSRADMGGKVYGWDSGRFRAGKISKTKMLLDKQAVKRLEDIGKLPEENKNFVLNLIDMALHDFKVKKAHAS